MRAKNSSRSLRLLEALIQSDSKLELGIWRLSDQSEWSIAHDELGSQAERATSCYATKNGYTVVWGICCREYSRGALPLSGRLRLPARGNAQNGKRQKSRVQEILLSYDSVREELGQITIV